MSCWTQTDFEVYICMVRRVQWRKKKWHGGAGRRSGLHSLSKQIRIGVFGMIHIHMGEGIGVGPFFGLFSAPVLTLVRTQTRTQARWLLTMENHSERTPKLNFGTDGFAVGTGRNRNISSLHFSSSLPSAAPPLRRITMAFVYRVRLAANPASLVRTFSYFFLPHT